MSVVLGAIGSLAPKLLQLLQSEYDLQKNLKKKVEFVHGELESIQAALDKVSAVPWDELDKQLQVWARQIRDASYDMEDVLDTFLLRVEGGEPAVNRSKLNRAMKKMGGLFGKFKARRDINGAIDDIEQKLQKVADWRARYKIDDIVANSARAADPRLLDFYRKASKLVGINEPRDGLIEMLSIRKDDADASNNEVKIISIVGIGGLGKTTLAKAVYDKVCHLFDCGAFVPVGCNPDPNKVLRDILIDLVNDAKKRKSTIDPDQMIDLANDDEKRKSAMTAIVDDQGYTGDDLMNMDQRQLINQLRSFLQGKRYFIVVDDIWDMETWEKIKDIFVDGNPRSRIIATTRKCNVSEKIGKVYRMKKLPESQSRELLYTRTFGVQENRPDKDELAVVSEKILHRCDGVPLAIVTIGSLLAGRKIEEWSNVYDSIRFRDGDDIQVNNMKKILSFGYYDLPCHLRTCMLYLGMFPEDYTVSRDKLISMWIAEGLVQQTEKEDDLFNVGESYFHELINRGMIQPVETYGFLNGCRVHDMVLHMIRDLSREELFLVVQDSSKQRLQASGVRRLALHKAKPIQVNDMHMKKVRYFNAMYCGTDMIPPVAGFKLLRVLSLVSCPLKGHLDTRYLGKLLHLRYLSLYSTPVRELHKDIGHLKFLQTLILIGTGIEELPTSLGQLTELMCLCADDKTRGPDWIGKLTSLVKLRIFFAAEDKCFVKELGNLRNLRFLHTRITLQDEEQVREFLLALSILKKMEFVLVSTSKQFACKDAIMQPSFFVQCCNNLRALVLDQLQFNRLPEWINPQALPKLCILSLNLYALYQQDMEIIGKFKQLCVLGINNSSFPTKISIYGGGRFQNLKHIRWHGLYRVQFVQGAMPVLEVIEMLVPPVCVIKEDDCGLDFGLRNLPELQKVTAHIDCGYCLPTEVVKVETELTHTFNNLPNRPTFEIHRVCEDRMVKPSDSEIERQKKKVERQEWRVRRLRDQNFHQMEIYKAMMREVTEMGKLITNLNLSGDIKNKVQGFHQQYMAITQRADKLLEAQDYTHIHDHRDLNRLMERNAALEQVLEILTVGYPLLAAMLDDLKYAFSLQGAMPSPQVINLNISVPDIKLKKRCLDLGLIGKISSLQVIKAHVICYPCFPTEVEEVEAELRHAIYIHHASNPPTLEIIRYGEDKMVNESDLDSQMLERQKWRARRLTEQIDLQLKLYKAMKRQVAEMGKLITNLNLSDDIRNKVQGFPHQYNAIVHHARDKQHEAQDDDTDIHDHCDLNRVVEHNTALEQALEILTLTYPLLAAELDDLKYALSLQGAMPSPQVINLNICVPDIKLDNLCLDFGLIGKIPSLQGIKAHVICCSCFPTEVEEVETELRQAVNIHHASNPPRLEIIRYGEDKMVNESDLDSQMLERQKWRAHRLSLQIRHQMELHNAMSREVTKMGELITELNLSNGTKTMVEGFDQQFAAIVDCVRHKQLLAQYDTHMHDHRDLNRVMEQNTALEQALEILTLTYPMFAAKLDDLKYALSLQGAMPSPQVINVNICVPDIKIDSLCLDFGLIGKISSLQGIKAHVICCSCFPTEVEEVEAELRQEVNIHHASKPPMLEIIRYGEDKMVNESDLDSQMLERQKWRARRLMEQFGLQLKLYKAMKHQVAKMGKLVTNLNLSDDIRNKTEGNAALEQALEIATFGYPVLVAMLDDLKYVFSLQGAMPSPQVINLNICVPDIKLANRCLDLGLVGKISSLQLIKAHVICYPCFPMEVEEVEAELRQAVNIHHASSNPPTLEIIRYGEDKMMNSDTDSLMLERQKWRHGRLWERIQHQRQLHSILSREAFEMVQLKSDMNLSGDAEHKKQRFDEHFNATIVRVQHELLRVHENVPNRDLKRLTEEIEDMERALEILTVEYPRLAAMLEELKTALSFQAKDEDEVTDGEDDEVSTASLDREEGGLRSLCV